MEKFWLAFCAFVKEAVEKMGDSFEMEFGEFGGPSAPLERKGD